MPSCHDSLTKRRDISRREIRPKQTSHGTRDVGLGLHCPTLERKAKGSRLTFEIVGIKVLNPKASVLDELGYTPGQVAPPGELLIQQLEAPLPTNGFGVGCTTVFNKMERALRL